jgi:hypothetical protein
MAFIVSIFLLLPVWYKASFRITKRMQFVINKRWGINFCAILGVMIILIRLLSRESDLAKPNSALSFHVQYLVQRFSYDPEKRTFKGDNRFYIKRQIDNIWLGDGGSVADITSPEAVIHRYGIIPSFFFYIPILFLTMQIINKLGFRKGKWISLVIWANLMQRPSVDNLYIMFLWTIIYYALDHKTNTAISFCRKQPLEEA